MRNATRVLRARPDDLSAVQRCAEMLDRQIGQLTRLVEDLLDISRVGSGKLVLKKAVVDLNEIVARAVESVHSLTAERQQSLSLTLAPQSLMVHGDDARLAQVIVNLLTNAYKYTPEGGSIRCETLCEAGEAVIRISDTGIGITSDLLPHVFELFSQGDPSLDRSEGGLGIGLALVERLVHLHEGRVAVHSGGRGQGSTFVVRLPLNVSHAAAA
jgi:signal transduction histidine kinase